MEVTAAAGQTTDGAALAVLLEANGFSSDDEDLQSRLSQITQLEMFLQDYPKMVALSYFSALTDLRLIDQRIEKIEGLQGCPNLKKLWLIENRIPVVENLESCTGLQELYLTSNKITDIRGLDDLASLKVLWLADNYISSITGISHLSNLQQLNLARNDIALIGSSLQQSSRLTSLNLADNHISCLQDVVSGLSSLSCLQDLCLADPFWGDCPVAALSNYQTFMLAQLPQLTSLDTLLLAQETKAAAAATLAKKQLYYNMRTRTLKRALGDLCRQAQAVQQAQAGRWHEVYASLAHAAKRLEVQVQEGCAEAGAQQQRQALQECMNAVEQQLAVEHSKVMQDCHAAKAALQTATSRLQLELSSAGNIWLEEGRPGDTWMQSCQDLLRSSCAQVDPVSRTAPGVEMLTATRIHNRHLRTQFAKHLQTGGSFEYLFFCDQAADAISLAQHGFSPAHNSWDLTAAAQLSTHLNPGACRCAAAGSALQVIVCKVCLDGPCKSLCDNGLDGCAVGQPDCIDARQYPGLKAVYRAVGSDSSSTSSSYLRSSSNGKNSRAGPSTLNSSRQQHRLWYVFDHTAILPEYIITCTVPASAPATSVATAVAGQAQACSSNIADCLESSGCKDALLRLCARPLSKWLCLGGQQPGQRDPDEAAQALQARSAEVLAAIALAPCPRLPYLTSLGLTVASGGKQLDSLTRLSLQDCGCTNFVGLLSHLPSLVVLALPFNKLTSLEGLAQSAPSNKLAELDVSHNRLATWCTSWLVDCTALTSLDASCNQFVQPADLQPLVRSELQLQHLDLHFNPVQQHKAYTATLSGLGALSRLDGAAVQQQQQQAGASCLTSSLLHDKGTLWHSTNGPVATLHTLGAGDWRQLLYSVLLEGQGLCSLQGLSAAQNLVAASLADNLISDLAELAGCSKLQRLDVSSNLVSEVQPLSRLVRLNQLDISCNQVSSLSALSGLTALTQLSCESNAISSLAGVGSMDNLVELYAAHNNLADIKEAERLSVLARLVVLDLAGNPLVTATDGYRLLLLYKLRSLKVLDGAPADAAELQAAQAQHAGRLTVGMLEELGSGCDLTSLRHIDLSAIGIKDCGSVFASSGPLAALTSLSLDSNHLTSLAPLAGLTRLVMLSINNNRPWDSSHPSWSFAAAPTIAGPSVQADQQGAAAVSGPAAAKPLLPSLQTLHLAGCGLTSLVPLQLQCLPALRSLFVQGNELSRLDGLEGLVQLRELVADKNRIRVLEPEVFSSLFRLQELRLDDNAIRNINPPVTVNGGMAACFPQLRVLQLSNNRLLDPSDCINRVAGIPTLTELSVTGNPFARKHQAYRQLFIGQCSQLQTIDGQPVTDEERDYVAIMDSPRFVEVPQYTAATLLAASAAAAETKVAPPSLPLARLQAAAAHSSAPEVASPKAAYGSQGLPTLGNPLSYEGLASLAAARQALLGSGLPGLLPTFVPSIQSGVLVLTGPASFGLEGTAMRGSSSSPGGSTGTAASPAASPSKAAGRSQLQQQGSPGNTARGNRRTTTGSIASYRAGGFVVRQATFQY